MDYSRIQALTNARDIEGCYKIALHELTEEVDLDYSKQVFCLSYFFYYKDVNSLKRLKNISSNTELKSCIDKLIDDCNKDITIDNKIMTEVKLIRQVGKGCVPATVMMLFNYYDHRKNYREVVRNLQCNIHQDGTSVYQLLIYLINQGFEVYPFSYNHNIILNALKQKYPVIAISQPDVGESHARMIYGIDEGKEVIYVNDPSIGRTFFPLRFFEKQNRQQDLCIIAIPSNQTLNIETKNEIYRDSEYYNLMGVVYDEQNLNADSKDMFEKGLELNDSNADLFNNFAILQFKMGNINESKRLSEKAMELEPKTEEYIETNRMICNELEKK